MTTKGIVLYSLGITVATIINYFSPPSSGKMMIVDLLFFWIGMVLLAIVIHKIENAHNSSCANITEEKR